MSLKLSSKKCFVHGCRTLARIESKSKDEDGKYLIYIPKEVEEGFRESEFGTEEEDDVLNKLLDEVNLNEQQDTVMRECLSQKSRPKDLILARLFDRIMEAKQNLLQKQVMLTAGKFILLPFYNKNEEASETLVMSGSKYSGKSYSARSYILEYMDKFPKNSVYLFSAKPDDKLLDSIPGLVRVNVTAQKWIPDNNDDIPFNITAADMEDSLCVFDDIHALQPKKLENRIRKVRDDLITMGRSKRVHVIATTHVLRGGLETKMLHIENDVMICYPKTVNWDQLEWYLKDKGGWNKNSLSMVRKILDKPDSTRWLAIRREPRGVITENKAFIN